MKQQFRALLFSALLSATAFAQQAAIPGVIAAGTKAEIVQEGFVFTEGPVGAPDGGVFFTDVRANKVYRVDAAGKVTTVRENSTGANGLAYNKSGELFAAEGAGKRISRGLQTGNANTVVDKADGHALGAPNDLILDASGGIYFTDPGTQAFNDPMKKGDIYYLKPDGKTVVHIDGAAKFPNGITLSVDGKTLIVADTLAANLTAYDVQADGSVKNKHVFATVPQLTELPQAPGMKVSGSDGMCMDQESRLYVTTGVGVQVFDKGGKFLGVITLPKQPSNCAFAGPDKKTMFVTARESVYKVKMLSAGAKRPGK